MLRRTLKKMLRLRERSYTLGEMSKKMLKSRARNQLIEEINKPNELNFAADSLANLGHTIPVNIFVFGLLL